MEYNFLASGPNTESYVPPQLLAGSSDVITATATVTVPANTTLQAGAVLGAITATGKLVPHAPAAADGSQNAVAILATPLTNSTGAPADQTGHFVYVAGEFAMQALVFNAATNSDALRLAVFPLTSPIKVRKLMYSVGN